VPSADHNSGGEYSIKPYARICTSWEPDSTYSELKGPAAETVLGAAQRVQLGQDAAESENTASPINQRIDLRTANYQVPVDALKLAKHGLLQIEVESRDQVPCGVIRAEIWRADWALVDQQQSHDPLSPNLLFGERTKPDRSTPARKYGPSGVSVIRQ
jgi:hypothetical protein